MHVDQQANISTSQVDKDEIKNLIEARKLLKTRTSVAWYWAILMIGVVGPALFFPTLLIVTVPISIAWILYLLILPPKKLKKSLADLKVKIHETRNLAVGDFCCPCQDELPLYQVTKTTQEPKLLCLQIVLSKNPDEIGTQVIDQREQFVVPYLFKD